jgi:hypothetical protein
MKVSDPNAEIIAHTPVTSLRPGDSFTVSATHTVTQADLDAGRLVNVAKASGYDLKGKPIEQLGNKVVVLGMQHPELITSAATSVQTYKNEGDVIEYTVVVKNTGNITLNNISVTDANADLNFSGSILSLAPGAIDSLKAEYAIEMNDINAGKIVNAGIARANDFNNQLYLFNSNEVTVNMAIEDFNLTNFPNPFSYETSIMFDLPERGEVILKVYDMSGKEVGQVEKKDYNQGRNYVTWKTMNTPKGLYTLMMYFNGEKATRRIVITR